MAKITTESLSGEDTAYMQQAAAAANAKQSQEALQGDEQPQPSFLQKWVTGPMGRVTTSMVDSAVGAADSYFNSDAGHKARDVVAGAMTGATNIADTGLSAVKNMPDTGNPLATVAKQAANLTSPIWDHARGAILDFRDAVAVHDPTLADNLVQAGAQLAIPFAGYSRALAGVHGFANMVLSGVATDASALGPHDPRMADLIALGRHTEGKLGEALRAMSPDGSAQNAYVNYLTAGHAGATPEQRAQEESEAEGRFRNVLDGFGANLIMTPLLHAAASGLKWGTAGLRYAVENGVGSAGDLMPTNQRGQVVFHGTGRDFDEFDSSKIGTGEGNQAFGHGLYFAENPETAGHYQQMLSRRSFAPDSPMGVAMAAVQKAGNSRDAYSVLKAQADKTGDSYARAGLTKAMDLIKAGNANPRGKLMSVDIPDEHIANMIDWDKPISEQPSLQKAFKDLDVKVEPGPNRDFQITVGGKPGPRYMTKQAAEAESALLRGEGHDQEAGMGYRQLSEALRGDKAASEYLGSKGIPGIRFLDQGSRDTGKGTRNLVLFDAKHAKIVGKE